MRYEPLLPQTDSVTSDGGPPVAATKASMKRATHELFWRPLVPLGGADVLS